MSEPAQPTEPRSHRLDEIVLQAAALDTAERTVFLRQLTRDDPQLVAEARRLLRAASDISESFLADPALDLFEASSSPSTPDGAVPTPVLPEDRYELGQLMGSGGMAEVFQAQDLQLDRTVALKLLLPGDTANLSRCLQEARAQAKVRHPHVLDVYDTGELEHRPFIALRWVDGATLREVSPDLSLEQHVEIFRQVAEGLDAAHAQGLVHRDVKPSNVLVERRDGALQAWVSDFGIAAVGQSAQAEGAGHLVGTVAYMAPERLDPRARPDRRSDVWSVGVLMFELLTGTFPFEGAGLYEQLRAIRRQPVPTPRDRVPSLPKDLEAIVLKCLAKDPSQRYPTCGELASDLQRFLSGDMVEAHTSNLAYRMARFSVKHRGWVRLAAVALVALLVSSAAAMVLGWRAVQSEREALARRDQAEDLVSFMLLDLRDKLDRLGRLELIDEVGTQAMQYFAAVPASDLSDDELARYGTALHQLGEVRMRQGDLLSAVEAFDQSLQMAQASYDRRPEDADRLFDLGQSQFWLGYGQRELGQAGDAEAAFQAYLDISRQLVDRDASNAGWQMELAYALGNLGTLRQDQGDLDASRQLFQDSFDIKQQLAEASPDDQSLQSELAWAHNALAVVLIAQGDSTNAWRHLQDELTLRQALVDAAPHDATFQDELAVTHNYMGMWRLNYSRHSSAVEHLRHAVDIHEGLVANDPTNASRQLRLAINRNALGQALWDLGPREESLSYIEATLGWLESDDAPRSGARQRELATTYRVLARIRRGDGDLPAALQAIERSIALLRERLDDAPDDRVALQRMAYSMTLHGDFLTAAGHEDAARDVWRQAEKLIHAAAQNPRDHAFRATWAGILKRLDEDTQTLRDLTTELHGANYCSPIFRDSCADCIIQSLPDGTALPGRR